MSQFEHILYLLQTEFYLQDTKIYVCWGFREERFNYRLHNGKPSRLFNHWCHMLYLVAVTGIDDLLPQSNHSVFSACFSCLVLLRALMLDRMTSVHPLQHSVASSSSAFLCNLSALHFPACTPRVLSMCCTQQLGKPPLWWGDSSFAICPDFMPRRWCTLLNSGSWLLPSGPPRNITF